MNVFNDKKAYLFCILAVSFQSLGYAQQEKSVKESTKQDDKTKAVVVYPLSLLAFRKISVDYQFGQGEGSFVVHGGYFTGVQFIDVGWRGFESSLSYRFILTGTNKRGPLEGFYAAPIVNVGSGERIVHGGVSGTVHSIVFGFDIGFQFVSNGGFTLNLNTGWRRRVIAWGTADVLDFPPLFSPIGSTEWWPGIGAGIGIAF